MKISIEAAEELIWSKEQDGFTKVHMEEGENRRWSRTNSIVVSKENKFYRFFWEEGLTESQETKMISDANEVVDGEVTLTEVEPVEITNTIYKEIK
jgi:hypothetical protein